MAQGLTLFYPGNPVPALNDVSFTLPARGLFAIVGRNGSGKSSLVRTFLGLQRDFAGAARVAGNDVLDYTPRWLRRQFGIVNQDSALFIGSVRENVSSGQSGDDARVWRALDASGARRFVEALPDGLGTLVQEGARNLSGGQRQRLIVARALYRDPPFLILDEPTAFLDPEAALALERNLAALGKDQLVLLVTHHLTASVDADRILVMDEGRIVGEGTHEELLVSCPTYASLWDDYHRSSNRTPDHSLSPHAGRGSGRGCAKWRTTIDTWNNHMVLVLCLDAHSPRRPPGKNLAITAPAPRLHRRRAHPLGSTARPTTRRPEVRTAGANRAVLRGLRLPRCEAGCRT